MALFRTAAGRVPVVCGVLFVLLALLVPAVAAATEFPYDRDFILDAARMGRAKRVPMLTVQANGEATVKLWCKDVPARVQIAGNGIRIEPGPLPDALPIYMSDGQCSPERMQADVDFLAVLAQTNAWQSRGDSLVLSGPTVLKFLQSTH